MRNKTLVALGVASLSVVVWLGQGCSSSSSTPGGAGGGGGTAGGGGHAGGGGGTVAGGGGGTSAGGGGGTSAGGGGGTSAGGGGGTSAGGGGGAAGGGGSTGGTGAVGKACTTDTDCNGASGVVTGLTGFCGAASVTQNHDPLFPTLTCIASGCTPDPNNASIVFCDGAAGTASATTTGLGICLNEGSAAKPQGFCFPLCTFSNSATAPTGCIGKDACNFFGPVEAGNDGGAPTLTGVGLCFGGCAADADCPTGSHCQTETGSCVVTKLTFTGALGSACSGATNPPTCNCLAGASGNGICTQFCEQGGTACGTGFECDSNLPNSIIENDAGVAGFTAEPAGLAGSCLPTCTPADGGQGTCAANQICSTFETAGPDCIPQ